MIGRRFANHLQVRDRMDRADRRHAAEARAAEARRKREREATVTICGWCPNAQERTRAAQAANGGRPVSHGMCPACATRMEAE